MTQTCTKCCEEKPATTEFFAPRRPKKPGGALKPGSKQFQSWCRRCVYVHVSRPATARRGASASRRYALKYQYDITPEQVAEIRQRQNNECAICRVSDPTDVDHCHVTMRVRGLLCRRCNLLLGYAVDSPDRLMAAVAYLLGDPAVTLSVIDLTTEVQHLGWCVSCDKHPATTLVVDDALCPIEGDLNVGAEFGVCGMCAEVVFPNAMTLVPEPRVPTHDGT